MWVTDGLHLAIAKRADIVPILKTSMEGLFFADLAIAFAGIDVGVGGFDDRELSSRVIGAISSSDAIGAFFQRCAWIEFIAFPIGDDVGCAIASIGFAVL